MSVFPSAFTETIALPVPGIPMHDERLTLTILGWIVGGISIGVFLLSALADALNAAEFPASRHLPM